MPITMKFNSSRTSKSKTQKAKSTSPSSRMVQGTEFIKAQLATIIDRMFNIVKTNLIESTLLAEAEKRAGEIKKFVETRAANTISRAFKSKFTRKNLASTKIAEAYRTKLKLVKHNKEISDLMCEGLAKKDVYRKQISDLLISHGTPQKLSNLYFYFCKFGNKVLGHSESSNPQSIIQEIVGCVFVNTSFASTNFNGILFKQSKFISFANNVGNKIFGRSAEYKTMKKNFGADDYKVLFTNVHLIKSQFIDCEFFNITLGPVNFFDKETEKRDIINNRFPTFKNCNFNRGEIIFYQRDYDPENYNEENYSDESKYTSAIKDYKYNIKLYSLAGFYRTPPPPPSTLNPDGTLNTPLIETIYSADIVFENCKLDKTGINTDYITKDGNRNIMFLNCIFESNLFTGEKFRNYYFKKCTFNKVSFISSHFEFSCFEDCTFNNTAFRDVVLSANGPLRFINCKILECTFLNVCFAHIPETKYTRAVIFDNTNIINNCTFRECYFSLFKFNFDSLYSTANNRDVKLLNLRNNNFIECNLYGVCFNDCDLEGTKFNARVLPDHTLIVNKFNWFGHVFVINPRSNLRVQFDYGQDKTPEFKHLCNEINPDGFKLFIQEFAGTKLANKKAYARTIWSKFVNFAVMKYSEYNALNINVFNFRNPDYNINPYDFFMFDFQNERFLVVIIPPVSMINCNIKNCNFSSAIGFETFDFTQVKKNYKNNPDLTAVNFTNVKLLNANFKGTNIVGTIFEAANIGGADFRNCVANANTSFQNTTGIELVPYQLQRSNGTLYIQGSKNNDTGREVEFSEIQQAANETHARIKYIIDNKDKLFQIFDGCGLPTLKLKELLISSHGGLAKYAEKVVISETNQTIVDFILKLISNYQTILDTKQNLTDDSAKAYIKKNFPIALTNYVSFKLNYKDAEKELMLANLVRAFSDEFMTHLVAFKPALTGNWCFLQLVTLSVTFLIINTDLYIHNFIQYYFNEIFNAHGKGSPSCTLGMVERWITVHSQAMEAYLMLLKKNESEIEELAKDHTQLTRIAHYNPANPKTKDSKITLDYIKEFNNSFSSEKIHNKYILHKFINVLKPYSILPEDEESDIGFDLDYNVSALMRKKGDVYIKKKINNGKITSLQGIYDAVVEILPLLIIENNNITQAHVAKLEADTRPKAQKMYRQKKDALLKYVKEVEAKDYIIGLMGFFLVDLSKEDIDTSKLIALQEKLKASGEIDMETIVGYYDDVDPTFVGGQKRRFTKARGLSPKIEYILEELVESTLINKLKAMSIEKFSNINSPYKDTQSISAKSAQSAQSAQFNLVSFNINDKPLILKNTNIQDKAYVSIIKNNYDAMQENYRSMIANMGSNIFKSAFKSTKKASLSILKRIRRTLKR